MNHDDAWQDSVRAALRASETGSAEAASALASTAIAQGTRRVVARTSARTTTVGLLLALGVVVSAFAWAEVETFHTAEATLQYGVSWTP
mgnify:CR=1 FL=1